MNTTHTTPDWIAEPAQRSSRRERVPIWWGITQTVALKVIVLLVLLTLGVVAAFKLTPASSQVTVPEGFFSEENLTLEVSDQEILPPAVASVYVHVAGEVKKPGLIQLSLESRVADALEAAGGPTEQADLAAINLAQIIADGEQIYVPAQGEMRSAPVQPGLAGEIGGAINLNTATEAELETLPGIGPVMAARIVSFRELNGPFNTIDDLMGVSGVGPSIMGNIRDLVTV